MAFWTQSSVNPKLKSRFIVKIGEKELLNVKSVTKPTFTIDTKTYTLINHKFKYPGLPNWEPITITFVDSAMGGVNDTEKILNKMINDTGYLAPNRGTHNLGVNPDKTSVSTPTKASTAANSFWASYTNTAAAKEAGGTIKIEHLDAEGKRRDGWTLHGPVIKSVNFGELSYDSDDLIEYTIEVEYDFAEYS